jgi:thiopurine S-methyltransferase
MNKEFWLRKWQTRDIGFNQHQPNPFLLTYFKNLNLKPGSRIFVPLCGKSIDMLWLVKQGYKVIGVELSLEACQLFYIENNISFQEKKIGPFKALFNENITLLSGDFFELNLHILEPIDAIYDRAALIALPTDMRQKYAEHIIKLCSPSTQMLLIVSSYDQSEMQGPPFSVDEMEVQALYANHFSIDILNNEPAILPDHLKERGLRKAQQLTLLLS